MASERTVRSGTAELFVRIDGETGPWIVLLNSLAADLSMWAPQVAALAGRFRILRFDTRGHGRSPPPPPPPYSVDDLVDDLFAVMRECSARPAHVVGLSLGGVVAAAAVLRDPAWFSSLAICDSRVAMPAEFRQGIDDRNRLVREKGMAAVVDPFIQRWFTKAAAAEPIASVKRMILGTSAAGFIGCSEALKGAQVLERLSEIRLPSLFIVGTEDAAVPQAVMRDQQRRVPNSRYAEIANAGHLSNLERPEAFNAALISFLETIPDL
jgi:3-oxoadipate enol-lactonase